MNNQLGKIKFGNWNAHSVIQKKSEIESMLHIYDLDLLLISETWLKSHITVWQTAGYLTYRCDRCDQRQGGGVAILVRRNLLISPITFPNDVLEYVDAIGVTITTSMGKIHFVSVYAPPNIQIPSLIWDRLINTCDRNDSLVICGDFNAHSWTWGSAFCNSRGDDLAEAVEAADLVVLNDSAPTFVPQDGRRSSNLDLIFVSSALCRISSVEVTDDSFASDHLLVTACIDSTSKLLKSSTKRLNIKKVDWIKFMEEMEKVTQPLSLSIESDSNLERVYGDFLEGMIGSLINCGAFYPQQLHGNRKSKPLWWDQDCEAALDRRRQARKKFLRDQTELNRINFRNVDNEVKWYLRDKKKLPLLIFVTLSNHLSVQKQYGPG